MIDLTGVATLSMALGYDLWKRRLCGFQLDHGRSSPLASRCDSRRKRVDSMFRILLQGLHDYFETSPLQSVEDLGDWKTSVTIPGLAQLKCNLDRTSRIERSMTQKYECLFAI